MAGRPTKYQEKMATFYVRLPQFMVDQLSLMAKADDRNVSDMVRKAVDEFLKRRKVK
jgi:Arc/MetJ-type ribon-helix-helix transcriptional regulator